MAVQLDRLWVAEWADLLVAEKANLTVVTMAVAKVALKAALKAALMVFELVEWRVVL